MEIIHKKTSTETIKKIFWIWQYRTWKSTVVQYNCKRAPQQYQLHQRCLHTCFWTSWAWNKAPASLCSMQHCRVRYKDAQPLAEGACMWDNVNWLTWLDMWTYVCFFESLQLEGSQVGDLLSCFLRLLQYLFNCFPSSCVPTLVPNLFLSWLYHPLAKHRSVTWKTTSNFIADF